MLSARIVQQVGRLHDLRTPATPRSCHPKATQNQTRVRTREAATSCRLCRRSCCIKQAPSNNFKVTSKMAMIMLDRPIRPQTPYTSLMKLAQDQPWKAMTELKQWFAAEDADHQSELNDRLAAMVLLARDAMKTGSFQTRIYADRVFTKRKYKANSRYYLRHVCQVALSGEMGTTKYYRAGVYATALRGLYHSDIDVRDIPAEIELQGGVTKMYVAALEHKAQEEAGQCEQEEVSQSLRDNPDEVDKSLSPASPAPTARQSSTVRPQRNSLGELVIEANDELVSEVIDTMIEEGEAWLKIEYRKVSSEGWVYMVARDIRRDM